MEQCHRTRIQKRLARWGGTEPPFSYRGAHAPVDGDAGPEWDQELLNSPNLGL